jgi:nitrogen fixation/metabolism regulation signal transduction histidine kinase
MFSGATQILKNSIGFRLLRSVLFWYIFSSLFFFFIQLAVIYKDERVSIEARAKNELINVSNMISFPLSLALEKKDLNGIKSVMRLVSNNPFVQEIEITSQQSPNFNQEIKLSEKSENASWVRFSSNLFGLIEGKQGILGSLTLSTSVKYGFFAVVTNTMIVSALINTLINIVVLSFLMLWASEHYISKPLNNFTNSVEKIELEKLHKVNLSDIGTEEGEIKKLQTVFNSLIERLDKAVESRKDYQIALEGSEQYLSAILDAMPSVLVGVNSKGKIVHSNAEARKMSVIELKENSVDQELMECFPFLTEHAHLIDTAINQKTIQTK